MTQFLYALTSSNTVFPNYFTVRIRRKFVIIISHKIPPHLKCVAALIVSLLLIFDDVKVLFFGPPGMPYSLRKPEMAIMTAKPEDYFIFGPLTAIRYYCKKNLAVYNAF